MSDNIKDNPGVIAPPPLLYAVPLVIGLLLRVAFPVRFLPQGWIRFLFGGILTGTAVLVVPLAFREMQRAHTNVNPTEPATALVVDGPFRFTRNPLYLSFTLFYSGIAVLANAFWAMLMLPTVLIIMRLGVIDREERYLERKFGGQYLRYKARVRRWI